MEVSCHTAAQTVCIGSSGVQAMDRCACVDEDQMDPWQLKQFDGFFYWYRSVFVESEQDFGRAIWVEHKIIFMS